MLEKVIKFLALLIIVLGLSITLCTPLYYAAYLESDNEYMSQAEAQETLETLYTQREIDLLARIVASEARGEPYEGQVAVAAVILNRVKDDRFPNTIEEVLFQKGQFEPVMTGTFWDVPVTDVQYKAVYDAIRGKDPSNGSLYFFNPRTSSPNGGGWIINNTQYVTTIGLHEFRY